MSVFDAKALACRPYRFEYLAQRSISNPMGSRFIEMSPITPETIQLLQVPEALSLKLWRTLPGNRWVCAVFSLENDSLQLGVWDLQSPAEAEVSYPALSVTSLSLAEHIDCPTRLISQLDGERQVVNFLLCYVIAG
ncbi:hypothetical protein DL93DRAFT_2075848 [Clavulina sp. PMI_390]|nr:hypothetical protein DL93DRAFT_2075848 [Clavulina sp. PMI_390]